MLFSNVIMYFIILTTASTLFPTGQTDIDTAAEAAQALQPLAGKAAGLLFALGVVGVGCLAVPGMTSGAAYDLCQTFGWHHSLHARLPEAKAFYAVTVLVTLIAVGLNFLGFNPMKALVWSGIVQGFSTPPLLLLLMLMTNNRAIMGAQVNSRALNILGWGTMGIIFVATGGLVLSWLL
jgi:Mn2+/Fe2+ NRAMP family transporter